ncbi:hypothetical protein [Xanthomonas sacchari]|uniref:hypothetical protein n=1 Tax=Xanthomonas sacchari TaxID=56458 RepID=UPI002256D2DC|nr:hypothetical protein [Xanthomonas sacchari]
MTDAPVLSGSLLDALPDARGGEIFTELLRRSGCRVERIVSHGQTTPQESPYLQAHDEWVLVLRGRAGAGRPSTHPGRYAALGDLHRSRAADRVAGPPSRRSRRGGVSA